MSSNHSSFARPQRGVAILDSCWPRQRSNGALEGRPRHESIVVDESTLDDLSQQSYKATFANGIADFFVPRPDYQVLREFRRRQVEIARLRS